MEVRETRERALASASAKAKHSAAGPASQRSVLFAVSRLHYCVALVSITRDYQIISAPVPQVGVIATRSPRRQTRFVRVGGELPETSSSLLGQMPPSATMGCHARERSSLYFHMLQA